MPRDLHLEKIVKTATYYPTQHQAHKGKATAKTKAHQPALLGADLTTASELVTKAAAREKAKTRAAEVAQVAMGLRSLATAAAALQKIPGAGHLADAVWKSLDVVVNRGGNLEHRGNKLIRKMDTSAVVGADWSFATIAPHALLSIDAAVTGATNALAKFGKNAVSNAQIALRYAVQQARPLADAASKVPGVGPAVDLLRKAAKTAAVTLGVYKPEGIAAPAEPAKIAPKAAKKLATVHKHAAHLAHKAARVQAAKEDAALVHREAARDFAVRPAPPALPPSDGGGFGGLGKWAPLALGAFLAAKVLL